MFGCIRWIIILALVAMAMRRRGALRDRWMANHARRASEAGSVWQPLSPEAAERARVAVQRLASDRGPVFETLHAAEVASYIFEELAKQLPKSAQDVHSAVVGDRMYVMATVRLSELGGAAVLGPLASMLSERDTVRFGGVFEVVRPGLAQFRVQEIRVRDFPVPVRLIPRASSRAALHEGLAEDGLPLTFRAHRRFPLANARPCTISPSRRSSRDMSRASAEHRALLGRGLRGQTARTRSRHHRV